MPKKPNQKSKIKYQILILKFKKIFGLMTSRISYVKSRFKIRFKTNKRFRIYIFSSFTFLFLLVTFYLFWGLPNPKNLTSRPPAASTRLLDRHGNLIYEIFADERRTPITLSSLPKYVWQATLAAEDKDFYKHGGFSIRGIFRALISNVLCAVSNKHCEINLQGGSTITQQLVKKALLSDDRTIRRKVREFILSAAVEVLYTKDQILEMYLNQVPYGGTAYGLESASYTYFGKSSRDLSLAEAALLAGLPQAPSYYSPFGAQPDLAKNRKEYVLKQMLDNKFINQEEYASASAQNLTYAPITSLQAPHFSLWVKDLLIKKYGLETVERSGLIVTTTLDLDLQTYAQNIIASETAKLKKEHVGNGAALVTRPSTGEILSMVGSRNYADLENDGNVNVVTRPRQPGSAIKPINYAIAIEHRLITPSTVLNDKPTCFLSPKQKAYCPDNYDNQFHGPTQVRFALANSFNIPAVKVLALNGLNNFIASSSAFGLSTWRQPDKYGPSLTLGGGEVTMYDLVTAYGVLANSGRKVALNPILEVQDRTGKILESVSLKPVTDENIIAKSNPYELTVISNKQYAISPPSDVRVISPGTAFLISHILYDNGARSATFGSSSYLNVKNHPEVSVKTGTTNDKRDNWTVGYNPDIAVGVWVGNNDNSPMSQIASGVTGASPIWNKIMTYALKDLKSRWPVQPPDVIGALVCGLSGLRASSPPSSDCAPRYEYFLVGNLPLFDSGNRKDIAIYRPNQTPATTRQQVETPDQIEIQNHSVITDPLGTILCLDCAGGQYGTDPDQITLDNIGQAVR